MYPIRCNVFQCFLGRGPRVVRGSVPGLGGLKETKMFLPHPRVKVSIMGSLRDRKVACSASDRQGANFESCVRRTVSSQSSHHPQEVLLAQFSLYVHKGGLKPDSFHFFIIINHYSAKMFLYMDLNIHTLILMLPIFFRLFFIHLKLELLTQFPASNDEKYLYL